MGRRFSQILLTLISNFSKNINKFEKQVQTLESVLPLISIYINKLVKRKAKNKTTKKTRIHFVFSTCLSVFRNQRKNTYTVLVFELLHNVSALTH